MKVVEREFKRELAASPSAILWNYWDHEHLYVVHRNYTSARVLYEDERTALYLLTFKLPLLSFLKSNSLNVMVQEDPRTIRAFNVGLFGIPACTTISVRELRKDHSEITMNYKFILTGWQQLLAPFLPRMMARWNEQVWLEDLPLKLRRQKVLRLGFRDFVGLPESVQDRNFQGEIPFELPIKRHKDSPLNFPL